MYKEDYKNITVRYDIESRELYINTTNTTHLDLVILVKTKSSQPYFIPLNITIRAFPSFLFNKAPYFLVPEGYMFNYTLNEELTRYLFLMNVTELFDDHNRIAWLNFSNTHLGELRINYDLET